MGFIWGTPYLMIRVAVRQVDPVTLVFFRTAPAALLLLPLLRRPGVFASVLAHWRAVLAYTAGELGVTWLFLFRAEQRISSSLAGLLIATVPLVSVALNKLTGREGPLGARRLTGLLLGLVGVAVLVGVDVHGSELLAVAEICVVAIGYAVGPFIVSHHLRDVPATGVVTASLVLTALAYAPFSLTHLPQRLGGEEIWSIVGLVLLCTTVAFLVFFRLIAEVGASRATVITYVNPAVALVLGILFLHEHLTVGILIGFPLVLVGCFLGTGGRLSPAAANDGRGLGAQVAPK
jgi:drug/metabolite transporter (DMT)-like permease